MILNDMQIHELCNSGMLKPFVSHQVRKTEQGTALLSYGISSYGYDAILSDQDVRIFTNRHGATIDPKRLDQNSLEQANIITDKDTGERYVILPPNSYLLGHTVEVFNMPRDIMSICLGKSTYARAGIIINVTPIEPGFIGQVVIEVANNTTLPARIYLNEGIAQFLFLQGRPCGTSYGDRNGKYQNQSGVTLPRV